MSPYESVAVARLYVLRQIAPAILGVTPLSPYTLAGHSQRLRTSYPLAKKGCTSYS